MKCNESAGRRPLYCSPVFDLREDWRYIAVQINGLSGHIDTAALTRAGLFGAGVSGPTRMPARKRHGQPEARSTERITGSRCACGLPRCATRDVELAGSAFRTTLSQLLTRGTSEIGDARSQRG